MALLNAGAVLVALTAMAGPGAGRVGSMPARAGWVLVALVLVVQVGLSALTVRTLR